MTRLCSRVLHPAVRVISLIGSNLRQQGGINDGR